MLIMELSTQPLSIAEPAFHSIAANYLSGSLQTDLFLSASCRTTTEASYALYTQVCKHRHISDSLCGTCIFGPSTCWNVRLKDQIKVMFWKCSFTKSLYCRSASLAEGIDMWRCSYRRRVQLKSNLFTKDPETVGINFVMCSVWLKIKHRGCFVTSYYLFDLTSWSLNINILVSRSTFAYHAKSTAHTVRTKSQDGDASLWLIQHFL